MNKYFYLAVVWSVLLASCSRRPNVQGSGEIFLQGIWNEDQVADSNQLLNYTQHRFKFTCDSFYVDLTTHSKANYYSDSCFNHGVWKEYAKGIYRVKKDSLFLEGTYTKSNYKQKVSGCYQIGTFLQTFIVKSSKADSLLLESITDQRQSTLVLKQKINCIPKAL